MAESCESILSRCYLLRVQSLEDAHNLYSSIITQTCNSLFNKIPGSSLCTADLPVNKSNLLTPPTPRKLPGDTSHFQYK